MKSRSLFFLLSLLVATYTFAGCGRSENSTSSGSSAVGTSSDASSSTTSTDDATAAAQRVTDLALVHAQLSNSDYDSFRNLMDREHSCQTAAVYAGALQNGDLVQSTLAYCQHLAETQGSSQSRHCEEVQRNARRFLQALNSLRATCHQGAPFTISHATTVSQQDQQNNRRSHVRQQRAFRSRYNSRTRSQSYQARMLINAAYELRMDLGLEIP